MLSLPYGPTLTSTHDYQENHSFDCQQTFVGKVMSLLFNMLSRFVIAFLPRSKCLNFMASVNVSSDFGAQENKICHCFSTFSPSIFHEVMGPDALSWLCFLLYILKSEIKTYHEIHIFKVYTLGVFSIYTITTMHFPNIFKPKREKKITHPLALTFLPSSPQSLANTKIVFISVDFPFLNILY